MSELTPQDWNELKNYARRESANGAKPVQNANQTPPWRRG